MKGTKKFSTTSNEKKKTHTHTSKAKHKQYS